MTSEADLLSEQQASEAQRFRSILSPAQLIEGSIVNACRYLLYWGVGSITEPLRRFARGYDIEDLTKRAAPAVADYNLCKCIIGYGNAQILTELVDLGWDRGIDVLCNFAEVLEVKGEMRPPWLDDFLLSAARNSRKRCKRQRGRDPFANAERDEAVIHIVRLTREITGFPATRNAATEKESACSIVAKALQLVGIGMNEPGVNALWRALEKGKKHPLERAVERLARRRRTLKRELRA